jgi:hypothetical protein
MNEEELERLQQLFEQRIVEITQRLLTLRGRPISPDDVDDWLEEMSGLIYEYHGAAALLFGGPDILSAIVDVVAGQIGYADDFGDMLKDLAEKGKLGLIFGESEERPANYRTPAQILAQARMYAGALRASAFTAVTRGLPLPAMPCEGTLCHTNCKCSWNVVDIDADAGDHDAYWIRGAKDSCQTCVVRAMMWNPVQIRGGILQL